MSRPRDRRPLANAELAERIRLAIGKYGPISQARLYEHVGGSAKRFRAAFQELLAAGFIAAVTPATRRGPRRHPLFVLPIATRPTNRDSSPANRDSSCIPFVESDTGIVIPTEDLSTTTVSIDRNEWPDERIDEVMIATYRARVAGAVTRSLQECGVTEHTARSLADAERTEN